MPFFERYAARFGSKDSLSSNYTAPTSPSTSPTWQQQGDGRGSEGVESEIAYLSTPESSPNPDTDVAIMPSTIDVYDRGISGISLGPRGRDASSLRESPEPIDAVDLTPSAKRFTSSSLDVRDERDRVRVDSLSRSVGHRDDTPRANQATYQSQSYSRTKKQSPAPMASSSSSPADLSLSGGPRDRQALASRQREAVEKKSSHKRGMTDSDSSDAFFDYRLRGSSNSSSETERKLGGRSGSMRREVERPMRKESMRSSGEQSDRYLGSSLDELLDELGATSVTVEPEATPLVKSTSTPNASLSSRNCSSCSKRLGSGSGDKVERGSQRFCRACYSELYLPKCRKCSKPIENKAIHSGDGKVKGKVCSSQQSSNNR
jgi:hypothetical protein